MDQSPDFAVLLRRGERGNESDCRGGEQVMIRISFFVGVPFFGALPNRAERI
jgi:hypothetical protein